MKVEEQIIREFTRCPDSTIGRSLILSGKKEKAGNIMNDTALASESSLKKDWLRPEEDEAWADL